jgi:hypothetical protein
MTTRANLYVDQGVDFLVTLELETNGEEYPITDQEFFCQVRKMYSTALAFEAQLEVIEGPPSNDLNLIIPGETTVDVQPGKYQYDLIIRNPDTGSTQKLLAGLLFIVETITRLPDLE